MIFSLLSPENARRLCCRGGFCMPVRRPIQALRIAGWG